MIGPQVLAFSPFDPWHMLVLGVVALLLFGKRLPEVGRSLGKGIAEFKKGLSDVRDELNRDEQDVPPKRRLSPPESEDERYQQRGESTPDDRGQAEPQEQHRDESG